MSPTFTTFPIMPSFANLNSLAIAFSKKWQNASNEKRESQNFLRDFLNIFGITVVPLEHFEYPVCKNAGERGYIDCLIKEKIAIEMKSRGENLGKAFEQLKEYVQWLPENIVPEILMVCDFETIILDFDKKKIEFKTSDLHKHLNLFKCLTGESGHVRLQAQIEANVRAAEKMAKLHEALKEGGYKGHELEVYLVRLLFCMFAEDTQIFPPGAFLEYVENSREDGSDLSPRIARLFEILNTSKEERKTKTNLPEELDKFEYINGGLFKDRLLTPDFTEKMRKTLIECASFDWSNISPAIFGSMFQGVMNEDRRRHIGAHYTSEENILKLINPLFMDSLREEFESARNSPKKLVDFHNKIASLKFLDPACGCGNFLIVAYRELRRLEIEILERKIGKSNQMTFDIMWKLLRVNVEQFYGIELEEFPCQIARVGMWLTDHQMNTEVSEKFGHYYHRLPLVQSATIKHGNALRLDWESVVPKGELSYILGNPPFAGARTMQPSQKNDMLNVFGEKYKGVGNLDYVTAWYRKAADCMKGTMIRTAFVSTNSITQGEQVALLWKPLFEKFNMEIYFACRAFVWNNEASGKAAVHCVIVGLQALGDSESRYVYENDGTKIKARNINPYLIDAPNIFIESRSKPLCDVPEIGIGNKPIDGGNYLFTESEKDEFLKKEPKAEKWFRKWIGSDEFINGYFRYCLWLGDCPPDELRKMPECMKLVEAVRKFRLESKSEGTRKIAETPRRFHVENIPQKIYIVIPRVSSERRKYIPIGFITPDILTGDSAHIIPNATLYHFGVLTSNVHNAWMRAICGRLEMRYRYSKNIVYNNFVWPDATDKEKEIIEKLAQGVLDARAKFPESSLAGLYDPLTMPPALLKAHNELDKSVMKLYGFGRNMEEAGIVAKLMEGYRGKLQLL